MPNGVSGALRGMPNCQATHSTEAICVGGLSTYAVFAEQRGTHIRDVSHNINHLGHSAIVREGLAFEKAGRRVCVERAEWLFPAFREQSLVHNLAVSAMPLLRREKTVSVFSQRGRRMRRMRRTNGRIHTDEEIVPVLSDVLDRRRVDDSERLVVGCSKYRLVHEQGNTKDAPVPSTLMQDR